MLQLPLVGVCSDRSSIALILIHLSRSRRNSILFSFNFHPLAMRSVGICWLNRMGEREIVVGGKSYVYNSLRRPPFFVRFYRNILPKRYDTYLLLTYNTLMELQSNQKHQLAELKPYLF